MGVLEYKRVQTHPSNDRIIRIRLFFLVQPEVDEAIARVPHGLRVPEAGLLLKAAGLGVLWLLPQMVRPQQIAQIVGQRQPQAVLSGLCRLCQIDLQTASHSTGANGRRSALPGRS